MVKRRWTFDTGRPGRPALAADLAALIVRLARENPRWGHRRIVGELGKLGLQASTATLQSFQLLRGRAVELRRPCWTRDHQSRL